MSHKFKIGDRVTLQSLGPYKAAVRGDKLTGKIVSEPDRRLMYRIEVEGSSYYQFVYRLESEIALCDPGPTDAELAKQYREHSELAIKAREQLIQRGFIVTFNGRSLTAVPSHIHISIMRPEVRETVVTSQAVVL